MKKIISIILALSLILAFALTLTSCGENITYDYALIYFHDGSSIKVELEAVLINGQQPNVYHIYGTDGVGYVVGSENCILVNDPDVDINKSTLSGTVKFKMTYEETIIRKPDGEIISIKFEEGKSSGVNSYLHSDDGFTYYTDPNNYWVKFTFEK
jgi:hypothetical protein